jgi:hypothetical protein
LGTDRFVFPECYREQFPVFKFLDSTHAGTAVLSLAFRDIRKIEEVGKHVLKTETVRIRHCFSYEETAPHMGL